MVAEVYAMGLISLSICVPKTWTREEIENFANIKHPTGIESNWVISEDKVFRTGEKIPNQCEDHEKNQHWLMNC